MEPVIPGWMQPKGAFLRLEVDVTFLVTTHSRPWPGFPDGLTVNRVRNPAVEFYRELFDAVGREYCWWMRQAMPDKLLRYLISQEWLHLMVLKDADDRILGFYELDLRDPRDGHLAYFGLLPGAIGQGLGGRLLDGAIAYAFGRGVVCLRVNTCTQDHAAALPNYRRAGFRVVNVAHEVWNVPVEYLPSRLAVKIDKTAR